MVIKLELKNFKCFEELQIDLKNVNIFTGVNGMGKSTVLQALLLLRQSYFSGGSDMNRLCLNGKYVELGSSQDVFYDKAKNEMLEISLEGSGGEKNANAFLYKQDQDFFTELSKGERSCHIQNILPDGRFIYLSAYRIKPQERYGIISEADLKRRDFGSNGEYALQYLNAYGDQDVENVSVIEPDERGISLMNQTRVWMDRVAPGVSPQIKVTPESRISELSYDFVEGKEKTNSYKSVNVGFGITYILPVIVALLSSKKDDLILIENPEAHIHPSGQRMLGELIARAGAGGAQILVETHSDHIINGLRIAVKEKQIESENVGVFFFYKDEMQGYKHTYKRLQINDEGKMSEWPEGFFDEWEKALIDLL